MDVVEEANDPQVSVVRACTALGVSRATLYRQTQLARLPVAPVRPPSPRRLSDPERQALLDVLHSEEFVDQPPPEVYARLLSRGVDKAQLEHVVFHFGEGRVDRGDSLVDAGHKLAQLAFVRPPFSSQRCRASRAARTIE